MIAHAALLFALGQLASPPLEPAARFVAFSLREADLRARAGSEEPDLHDLAGITSIVGMVHDTSPPGDLVLVGVRESGSTGSLAELVVALRARLVLDQWPMLSLDATTDDPTRLVVSTAGGIRFGPVHRSFLDADIFLKEASIRGDVGLQAYREMLLQAVCDDLEAAGKTVVAKGWSAAPGQDTSPMHGMPIAGSTLAHSRFWLTVDEPYHVAARDGVFCIERLDLCCRLDHSTNDPGENQGKAAIAFAAEATARVPAWLQSPEVAPLSFFFEGICVAEAIAGLAAPPELSWLLHGYQVERVESREDHPAEQFLAVIELDDGSVHALQITGGLELRAKLQWLEDGDVSVLRDLVLSARPGADTLWWPAPLGSWDAPRVGRQFEVTSEGWTAPQGLGGMSVVAQQVSLSPAGWPPAGPPSVFTGFEPPRPLTPGPATGGVWMGVDVIEAHFGRDPTGLLLGLRQAALASRSSPDQMSWSLPAERADR
jgi:hypothetical protein